MKYFLNISGIFDADWDFPYKNDLKRFSIFRISQICFFMNGQHKQPGKDFN